MMRIIFGRVSLAELVSTLVQANRIINMPIVIDRFLILMSHSLLTIKIRIMNLLMQFSNAQGFFIPIWEIPIPVLNDVT